MPDDGISHCPQTNFPSRHFSKIASLSFPLHSHHTVVTDCTAESTHRSSLQLLAVIVIMAGKYPPKSQTVEATNRGKADGSCLSAAYLRMTRTRLVE